MSEIIDIELREAAQIAEKLRDKLFGTSQNAVAAGDVDLDVLQRLFSIIQKVEVLRREIDGLRGPGDHSTHRTADLIPESKHRVSKEGYPRYSLRDGSIVRTGMGQNGLEYEHVLKRPDFERIIDELNKFSGSDGFSVDEILKGLNLPSYLTYLVVSLLKERLGKLESPKRGRYRFNVRTRLDPNALIEELRTSDN